jgi:hypothetical protein
VWGRMSPAKHFLHLTGRLSSGEIVYSDGFAFFGEQSEVHRYAIELKPGIRVEGRLDQRIERPIKNGWVQLSVHSNEANTNDKLRRIMPVAAGNTGFWWSYRPIADDGSFVFETVPQGELKVIAYGEGFISANGIDEIERWRVDVQRQPPRPATRAVPQSFASARPVSTIEVATERTATLEVLVKSGGRPVPNAKVHVWPNMIHMPTGSRLFGAMRPSSEETLRKIIPPPPEPTYSVITDEKGIARLPNIPAFTRALGVEHPGFVLPLKRPDGAAAASGLSMPRREVEVMLSPGVATKVEVALGPRGEEFIGQKR